MKKTTNENALPYLIRYFREKKNYTQEQMASMLCISRSTYTSYETGRIMPGIQQIIKISKILEHDFLFAYAMSAQNSILAHEETTEAVYEDSPYKALPKEEYPDQNLANNISQLSAFDQELLKTYVKLRIQQGRKDTDNETIS